MTKIISAFPGCGKSHLFRVAGEQIKILDSDSSKFDKDHFPANYIEHIKNNIGKADIILVSSHKVVRDALVENGIDFTLVYPSKDIRDEYINRYISRGNTSAFVTLLNENWESWISECVNQEGFDKIELNENEYLSNVIDLTDFL